MITSPFINLQPYVVLQAYLTAAAQASSASSGELTGEIISPRVLKVGCDNDVVVHKLRFAYDGAYAPTATLACAVRNAQDVAIVSDVTLDHVIGTDGDFHGVIQANDAALFLVGEMYWLEISGVAAGSTLFWRVEKRAAYRGNV